MTSIAIEQLAIESSLIYLWNMVIFHGDVTVYQRLMLYETVGVTIPNIYIYIYMEK